MVVSPFRRGGNWDMVACKRSLSQFSGREITRTLSSWCKTTGFLPALSSPTSRGEGACPLIWSQKLFIRREGEGRRWQTVWRYEGKGSSAEQLGSRCDNDNELRPNEPLAFKKRETPLGGNSNWDLLHTSLFFRQGLLFLFPEIFIKIYEQPSVFSGSMSGMKNLKNSINLVQ